MNAAGQSNPELRKTKIYSWEKGFIEDKEDETTLPPKKTSLRKDDLRKSEQALTKQLKQKIKAEMGSTVKTSAGSIYRKSDIAQAKIKLQKTRPREQGKAHPQSCKRSFRK